MPIFMDRHDIPEEITAAHVAQMHREDLKIEHLYGCKGMTYWCDEKRRTAFCLIAAPNRKAIQDMHNHAHGDVPHRIIEVESAIVESFLGRIEDPEKSKKTELNIINDPAFRTLMVIGLTQTSFKAIGPDQLKKESKDSIATIQLLVQRFLGRVVRQRANEFLVSFNSVTAAVHCAQAVYAKINNSPQSKSGLLLGIGLHAGVPVTDKDGIFEETIKSAEHFSEMGSGRIVISSEVKELYESEHQNNLLDNEYVKALNAREEVFAVTLMDYVVKKWHDPDFGSKDLSKDLGYSKSQLYRKMLSITGKSPNNFIREYRLNKAKQLLCKNTKTISEIAFGTGFNSPAYFSKCFMDTFGILPSDYIRLYVN